MTAALALTTALAGCGGQDWPAGTRQVPIFGAGCGDRVTHAPRVPGADHGDDAVCRSAGSEDGQQTPRSEGRARVAQADAVASEGVARAPEGDGDRPGRGDAAGTGGGGTASVGGEAGGVSGSSSSGGTAGDGDVGGTSGGGEAGGTAGEGAGGDGDTGTTGGDGTTSTTGGDGTTGTTGGDGATGTTGGDGGTGGDGATGDSGVTEGDTTGGAQPSRQHTGKPVDGLTGKPAITGKPPGTP